MTFAKWKAYKASWFKVINIQKYQMLYVTKKKETVWLITDF